MDLHKHHGNKGAKGWVQPVLEVSVTVKLWKTTSIAHPYPHNISKNNIHSLKFCGTIGCNSQYHGCAKANL